MLCSRCRQENPPQARFCQECGARLASGCPACGAELPACAKFCVQCGRAAGALSGLTVQAPAPEAHTPRYLAEKILTSRAALEGERKHVTVLFADLKGSLELLAGRDPEDARRLLDPVLERMMEAVHRYEGTVNQVMGDGIMALFGAPLAHEDHAVRACYAALRMQESVREYAQETQRTEGVPIHIRVGLNSGEVVVRSIGSDLHMDYTAVGETTHLAARMEQMAMPGSILITANTLRLVEGYVRVESLGSVSIKGLNGLAEVYQLGGAGLARTRLQAAAARGLTRFVGRQDELEVLCQVMEKARAGHGQVVALVGEPGVGKSRLFWEFSRSHRAHGWLILEGGAASYGKATPCLPIIDLLKGYFGIETRDDQRKIREKVTGRLLTLDRTLEPTLAALLAVLDVPVKDPEWQALEPPGRRQRILDAVRLLLLRESQVEPLCVVLEDLHWIDSETQAFLDSLVESLPAARLLLLVNFRPEYRHGWASKTSYTQLRIDPLPPESAEDLLRAVLGDDPGLGSLKRLLIGRTEGNPFFLEECVRTLVETQVLVDERGAHRLAKALPDIQVPPTVHAVLSARIDRLAPEDKRLLQSASVIGETVPFTLLQAVAEMPEEELHRGLSRLQAAEFLYEASLFPDLEYAFKHGLTHQVAYNSLLAERRRHLHSRIVDAIERLYPDRLAEQVDRLAQHAFRGEVWDRAVAYLRQAGAKAASRSAYREAVACLEQALVALGHLPEDRETIEQSLDLRLDLRRALLPLGESERILHHLREAQTLAEALGDQRRSGRVSAYLANHFWWVGNPEQAVESGKRALAIADAVGDFALQVTAHFYLGQASYALGDCPKALDLFRRAVAALESGPAGAPQGVLGPASFFYRSWLIRCLAERGEFVEGLARAREGAQMAEAIGQPHSLIAAFQGLGLVHLGRGELHQAIDALERDRAFRPMVNLPALFIDTDSLLGYAYALSGRLAEGLSLLEEGVNRAATIGMNVDQSIRTARLGEASLLAGRADDAIRLARRALDLARNHKERGHEACARRLLGEIASHRDPPDVEHAEREYHEALALAEGLGMSPLVARCHLALGKLSARTGNRQRAAECLTTAARLFRDMDMPGCLEPAEAELKELGTTA